MKETNHTSPLKMLIVSILLFGVFDALLRIVRTVIETNSVTGVILTAVNLLVYLLYLYVFFRCLSRMKRASHKCFVPFAIYYGFCLFAYLFTCIKEISALL